jgi:YVTN family beta-propeller protein
MKQARAIAAILPILVAWWPSAALHAGASNSLMDISSDGKRLLVANPDSGTVTVVDLETRKALHEIAVGEKPEGVTWIGSGPLAAVTVWRENRLVFLNADDGKIVKSLPVAHEPYGIVATRDGSRAWVTHDFPGSLTEIDLHEMKVLRETKVGSFLRGICFSADEALLYVTEFYTAALLAVDVKSGKVVDSWKGRSDDNLCRHVVVHPTRPKAYLTHLRSRITVALGEGSIFPILSVCDLVPPGDCNRRTSIQLDTLNSVAVPCNPFESALSPDGKRICTIYSGTDDINVCDVLDDNYKEVRRVGTLIHLGKQPRAIRFTPDGSTICIYNTMDFEVTIHQAADLKKLGAVTVCKPAKTPEWVQGKVLFNSANPPMTSRRWIACSSCHPDGLADGRVWQNPEGLRKTPSLFGLAHTHPLHWSADRDEVQDFEYTIEGPLMQGRGFLRGAIKPKQAFQPTELDETTAGRSKELDALAIYTNSFEFPLSPNIPAAGRLSPSAQRGKKLFFDTTVGCASCHSGPYYSDNSLEKPFKLHDVGTGKDDPSEKIGPTYKTPTLLGVYRTAPYLHHGKAATLQDVLTTCNKDDRHGKTSHLKKEEIEALVDFLKALPYEPPPLETPNTVKYRLAPGK